MIPPGPLPGFASSDRRVAGSVAGKWGWPQAGPREARNLKPGEADPRSNPAMESARPLPAPAAGEDERELLGRARAGDASAYRVLVERHQDRAYGLALRILRSPADAEEVAQDGFVRAWLALPRFRGESSFGTWLHRIVARRAFDRAAVLKARRSREAAEEEGAHIAGAGGTADAGAALAMRLERLMAKLNERERAVVTLFYYEGRSVEQVSKTLLMPEGTVKSLLSRARAELREGWLREVRSGR